MEAWMKGIVRIVFFLLVVIITGNTAMAAGSNSDYETARKYYFSGRYTEAVRHLEDYIAQKPDAAAYYMMGYALYKLKRFDEANEYFRDAYLLNPSFSPIKEAPGDGLSKKAARSRVKKAAPAGPPPPAAEKPSGTAGDKQAAVQPQSASAPAVKPADAASPSQGKAEPAKPAMKPGETAGQTATTPTGAPAAPQPPVTGAKQPAAPPAPVVPQPQAPLPPLPKPGGTIPAGGGALFAVPMLMGGLFAGFTLVFLGIALAIYLFFSYCMYRIATRLNCPAAWTAWVPILNMWPIVGSAGKPWWWVILLFVPLVGFFVWVYLWMCIVENLGRNKWLGLLMLVPVVNIVYMVVLAFSGSTTPSSSSGGELE